MECMCFPCDLKSLFDDESVIITFELNDGQIIQNTKMFVREAEELLARWITD